VRGVANGVYAAILVAGRSMTPKQGVDALLPTLPLRTSHRE
jgi:hypothetical protein